MRWFRRKQKRIEPPFIHDGITRNRWSAYWWEPGCKCHWSAGIEGDYCDFCKAKGDA
jgi:hypothetical protein